MHLSPGKSHSNFFLSSPFQLAISFSELFPTGVRSLAVAHFNITGRMGNIIGPLIFTLVWMTLSTQRVEMERPKERTMNGIYQDDTYAYALLGGLGILEVTLYLLTVPETKGIALPNEMPEKKRKSEKV